MIINKLQAENKNAPEQKTKNVVYHTALNWIQSLFYFFLDLDKTIRIKWNQYLSFIVFSPNIVWEEVRRLSFPYKYRTRNSIEFE